MSSVAYWQDPVGRHRVGRQRTQRKNERATAGMERFFSVLIIFLALVLAGELLFHFVIAPRLLIKEVLIHGAASLPLSDDEILKYAGIAGGESYLKADPAIIAGRIESIPFIKEALVKKKFPGSLTIVLTEHLPVATVIARTGERSVPLFVSSGGVLFPHPGLESGSLPVISGIEIPEIRGYMNLPSELSSFLEDLQGIRSRSPELYSLISELKFVKKEGSDFEVLLFPAHTQIRVRIGASLDEQLLTYILMILDVVKEQEIAGKLEEIDFRTGVVVYRIREE